MLRELDLLDEMKKRYDWIELQIVFMDDLIEENPIGGTAVQRLFLNGWKEFSEKYYQWIGRLEFQKEKLGKEIEALAKQIAHDEEEMMRDARSLLRD